MSLGTLNVTTLTLIEGVTLAEILTEPDGKNDSVFEIDTVSDFEGLSKPVGVSDLNGEELIDTVSEPDGDTLANNDKLAVGEALFELATDLELEGEPDCDRVLVCEPGGPADLSSLFEGVADWEIKVLD